jgi:hypothetical protein
MLQRRSRFCGQIPNEPVIAHRVRVMPDPEVASSRSSRFLEEADPQIKAPGPFRGTEPFIQVPLPP